MARKVKTKPRMRQAESKVAPQAAPVPEKKKPDQGEELLLWTVTPVLKDRRKGAILVACILSFAGLVYFGYRDWFWPVVAVVLSTLSFNSFLLPNTYKITTTGVVFRNGMSSIFKPWDGFVRYRSVSDGVYLVFKKTIRTRILGAGIFMYFGDNNKEQVMSILEANMGTSGS